MDTKLKPYEEYKETEYDWLGSVPRYWKQLSIRNITELSNKRNGERMDLELLSVYREYGVIRKSSRDDNHNVESEDLSNYKYVDKGYLVLNKMKMWQGSLGVSKYEGIVSPAYIVCKLKSGLNFNYINYLLRAAIYKTIYNRLSYGVRVGQWDMRYGDFKNIKIYIPSKEEQDQIVRYLDSKLLKINKFIKVKKKQIELLKEQKQAVINQAVTKGLDPNVEMKPSGIEWMGDIPEEWELRKLKTLGEAIIGLTYSPGDLTDEKGNLVLRSSNVKDGKVQLLDNIFVRKDIPEKLKIKLEDILICSRNGSKELVGKCALIGEESENMTFGAFMSVYRSKYNKFIYYVLNSNIFKSQCASFFTSTISQLTLSNLNNMIIPFPTPTEREAIIDYIETKTKAIDKLISAVEIDINLMIEYKISLISNVVTGKVDVRNFKVEEAMEELEYEIEDLREENMEEEEIEKGED